MRLRVRFASVCWSVVPQSWFAFPALLIERDAGLKVCTLVPPRIDALNVPLRVLRPSRWFHLRVWVLDSGLATWPGRVVTFQVCGRTLPHWIERHGVEAVEDRPPTVSPDAAVFLGIVAFVVLCLVLVAVLTVRVYVVR